MMRPLLVAVVPLLFAACSKAPDGEVQDPSVNVTAAPGVAFSYAYRYTIPPANISRVQEAHAQACERLGITRCRITGMTYNVRSSDSVDGSLAMKLEPSLARAFGRQGTEAVQAADGMLSNAAIEGTDVGSEIADADDNRQRLIADRARLDREIAANPAASVRAELVRQREQLDSDARSTAASTRSQRALLASTPVTFSYASGDAIRSLHAASPIRRAADTAIASLQATLSFVLQAIALLLAPAAALALLWIVWRWQGRRLWRLVRGPDIAGRDPPA